MSDSLENDIKKYTEQLAVDPKSRVFVPLSEAYRRLGRYEEAILVAKEGLTFHPTYVAGKTALARAYFEYGDIDLARELLEDVIHVVPDNFVVNRLLVQIYVQQGNSSRAIPLLQQLISLDPADQRSRDQLQKLGVKTSARSLPEGKGESEAKNQSLETATLAELYQSQGHLDKALEIYRKLESSNLTGEYAAIIRELEVRSKDAKSSKKEILEALLGHIQKRRRAA